MAKSNEDDEFLEYDEFNYDDDDLVSIDQIASSTDGLGSTDTILPWATVTRAKRSAGVAPANVDMWRIHDILDGSGTGVSFSSG